MEVIMGKLFPNIQPYEKGYLRTRDNLHEIYYEILGNPNGFPVLYVHGGPGAGASKDNRRIFDPKFYKIVIFDQRGCGESKPSMSLENNTTWHLVDDIELIREHCNIDKWILLGGSWGTTLSLCYAIKYPNRVRTMVLRGVFLARKKDLLELYQEGTSYFNPIDFQRYISLVPEKYRNDVISYYHYMMHEGNEKLKEKALIEWARWESVNSKINKPEFKTDDLKSIFEIALIENHYFFNNCFFEENYILNNVDKIKNIQTYIIHGAHDLICWPEGAYLLHKQLNNSELNFINEAGHSQWEDKILSKIIDIFENLKKHL
ncbi:prolyl aminopeptidase [Mycoplasma tauri]|nr:prolyl aminopeptidase [Mycoplasma tauri]